MRFCASGTAAAPDGGLGIWEARCRSSTRCLSDLVHGEVIGLAKDRTEDSLAVLRRARGMRDEVMLLLKLKWATARPIRSSRDLIPFLQSNAALKSVKTPFSR